MTLPFDLNELQERLRAMQRAKAPERPAPCTSWCALSTLPLRTFSGAAGYCTCVEPCQWDSCPADTEAYVPPAVPRFREEAA